MIEKMISFLVYLETRKTKAIHSQFTGMNGYWIAYGKIGETNKVGKG